MTVGGTHIKSLTSLVRWRACKAQPLPTDTTIATAVYFTAPPPSAEHLWGRGLKNWGEVTSGLFSAQTGVHSFGGRASLCFVKEQISCSCWDPIPPRLSSNPTPANCPPRWRPRSELQPPRLWWAVHPCQQANKSSLCLRAGVLMGGGGHRCLVSIQIQVRGGTGSCPLGWGQDGVGWGVRIDNCC